MAWYIKCQINTGYYSILTTRAFCYLQYTFSFLPQNFHTHDSYLPALLWVHPFKINGILSGGPFLIHLHSGLSVFRCVPLQFISVTQSCLTLCDPMNRSMPGLPVPHQLPESTQTYVHCVGDTIQTYHPLSSPSPPALNLSHHQGGLFKWVNSPHEVAKVLQFQLQHQSLKWTPWTGLL